MNTLMIKFSLLLVLFSLPFSMQAVSIYQWVDTEGVTHFADEPPASTKNLNSMNSFEYEDDYPQAIDPEKDYYSIANQWKRTNDNRLAEKKIKAEYQESKRRSEQASPVVSVESQREPVYYPVYTRALRPLPYGRRNSATSNRHFQRDIHQRRFDSTSTSKQLPQQRGYVGNVLSRSSQQQ